MTGHAREEHSGKQYLRRKMIAASLLRSSIIRIVEARTRMEEPAASSGKTCKFKTVNLVNLLTSSESAEFQRKDFCISALHFYALVSDFENCIQRNMRLLRILPLLLIVVGAVILFERPAYAYADPGTGLLAIQAVGSALVASGWYLRRKIYALFNKGGAAVKEAEAAPAVGKGDDSPNS
jgi:hypothetical protein